MAAQAENEEWYYLRGDEPEGPVSAKTLRSKSYGNLVDAETLVWNEKYGDEWKKLRESEIIEQTGRSVRFFPTTTADWYVPVGVILAIGVALSIFLYLSVFRRTAEEQALREAFIRLGVSIEHGLSLRAFSDDVIDIQTKFELARSRMNGGERNTVRDAIAKLSAVHKLCRRWHSRSGRRVAA
jgi:hypothetical protein